VHQVVNQALYELQGSSPVAVSSRSPR